MSFFQAVVAIAFIIAITVVLKARAESFGGSSRRDRERPTISARNDAENARLQSEIKALKERISVLERLATDEQRNLDLDREIASLRDPRP